MLTRNRVRLVIASTAVCGALIMGGAATAPAAVGAPQSVTANAAHDAILGTWVGTFAGFEQGKYNTGLERFVITKAKGIGAKGTWAFKEKASDAWSKPQPVQFNIHPAVGGGWTITGVDVNGIYIGAMNASGNELDLTYQGSNEELVSLHFVMHKK